MTDRSRTYEAGRADVKGIQFDLWTNNRGEWLARVDQNVVSALTRDALLKQIARELAKKKISVGIRFMTYQGGRVRRGTATGRHTSNGNVLVRWDDGESGQLNSWGGEMRLADSDENAVTWKCLQGEYLAAVRAKDAFEKEHKIDLGKEVRAALDAAVAGGEETA